MEQIQDELNQSTNFVDYIEPTSRIELETLYGKYYPEVVDIEMKKIVKNINKSYIRRYGSTVNEVNESLKSSGICLDSTPNGYLYGNKINQTWEWATAVITNDLEYQEFLIKKEKILEAKYKGYFINANIEDLCNRSFMSKQLLSLSRRETFNTEIQQEHFLKTWE
jgi:hypothetical protein